MTQEIYQNNRQYQYYGEGIYAGNPIKPMNNQFPDNKYNGEENLEDSEDDESIFVFFQIKKRSY